MSHRFGVPIFFAVAALLTAPAWSAIETQGEVSYMNGGIGKDEADAIRAQASRFPLELPFVRRADGHEEFVVDVAIRSADRAGRVVLELPGQGPVFLVNLPPTANTGSISSATGSGRRDAWS